MEFDKYLVLHGQKSIQINKTTLLNLSQTLKKLLETDFQISYKLFIRHNRCNLINIKTFFLPSNTLCLNQVYKLNKLFIKVHYMFDKNNNNLVI